MVNGLRGAGFGRFRSFSLFAGSFLACGGSFTFMRSLFCYDFVTFVLAVGCCGSFTLYPGALCQAGRAVPRISYDIRIMAKQITIEEKADFPGGPSYFSVYEFGVYPRSSVLSGQTRKSFLDSFESLEAAKADYPMADFAFIEARNTFGNLPGSDELDGQGGVWGV